MHAIYEEMKQHYTPQFYKLLKLEKGHICDFNRTGKEIYRTLAQHIRDQIDSMDWYSQEEEAA